MPGTKFAKLASTVHTLFFHPVVVHNPTFCGSGVKEVLALAPLFAWIQVVVAAPLATALVRVIAGCPTPIKPVLGLCLKGHCPRWWKAEKGTKLPIEKEKGEDPGRVGERGREI